MWIDTHAHVNEPQFDADRDAVRERARQAGVIAQIEVAESPAMWQRAVESAERHDGVFAALGVHPHHAHEVADAWPDVLADLRRLARHPQVVAIGECGTDYYRPRNTPEQQRRILRDQLALAQELGKPVILHCREGSEPGAHRDLQAELAPFFPSLAHALEVERPAGVVHCFSGTWADAQWYMARGFLLGVDGPVSYPSAKALQENVVRIPLQRLVLETDSPYLPPQSRRGQRNEPAYLVETAKAIADLKRLDVAALSAATCSNARRLFRLPQAPAA